MRNKRYKFCKKYDMGIILHKMFENGQIVAMRLTQALQKVNKALF
jgi:hypothetical protein